MTQKLIPVRSFRKSLILKRLEATSKTVHPPILFKTLNREALLPLATQRGFANSILIAAIAALVVSAEAATYPLTSGNNGQTISVVDGDVFTDSGNVGGSYSANENRTITFQSPVGTVLSIDFSIFTVEENWDFLRIYDGSSTASPQIGPTNGYSGPIAPGNVVASGNALTFRFTSDGSVQQAGWVGGISVSAPFNPATLGNLVWIDTDGDGVKDGSESGLPGVLVELLDQNNIAVDDPNSGGFQAYSVVTGASGDFSFTGLTPGNYKVKIATPPGAYGTSSTNTDVADNQQDNDDNGIQTVNGGVIFSPVIALADGETDNTLDFGLVPSPVNNYTFNNAPLFDWFDGTSGAVWNATATNATYDLNYTDSFGNSQSVTVTMTIDDPSNRNGDSNASVHASATHPFDPSGGAAPYPGSTDTDNVPGNGSITDPWDSDLDTLLTQTNGGYGLNYLTMGIKVAEASERVGYRFSFSKPVRISNLQIGDIDSIGVNFSNEVSVYETLGNSFQDRVEFYGRNGDVPVQMTVSSGARLFASNGTVYNIYDTTFYGDLQPTDPLGTTTVSSDYGITELEIYYSNGGDDAVNEREQPNLYSWWSASNGEEFGVSDDQGIRISGFGLVVADEASISGTVEEDTNNDDAGDSPISGVTLTLYSDPNGDGDPSDGAPVDNPNVGGTQNYTVDTEVDGTYEFVGLPAGDYVVVETQPSGFLTVNDNDSTTDMAVSPDDSPNSSLSDNLIPVSLSAGEADTGNDFVEERAGSLSGTVLADTNNDNTGDTAISGVTLTLKDASGNDIDSDPNTAGVQPTTTTTDGNGDYSFTGLTPGSYRVVETQPSGYDSVSDVDGANNNIVGDETPIAVTAGNDTPNNDFVEEQPGSLSGTVLADTNNDNTGDTAISGVTLTLKDASGNDIDSDPNTAGVQPTTTTTDGNGDYSFTGLTPGSYRVVETQPSGYDSVSDVDGANNDIVGDETPIVVTANNDTPNNDFVEEQPGSLSGTVLADTDNDDLGDTAIAGVTLTLKDASGNDIDSDPNTAGVQPTTTTTDGNGDYSFTGLTPGNYRVVETQPSGYDSVSDADGANNDIVGDETPIAVTAGNDTPNNDFVEEQPGSLSGTVLADTDNDDLGDTAIAGVTLTLKDASGNDIDSDPNTAGVQPTTTTTDGNGDYSFTGLTPGNYRVVETQPSGYDSVSDVDGANNNIVGDETPITVTANNNTPNNDFVEEQPGSLSGTVLADTNNDDLGDTAIAGVTLTLKDASGNDIDSDPNTAGVQPTTTTTDGNGDYSFTGLTPGNYRVVETQPSGYDSVSDVDGANNNIVGDETPITVTANNDTPANDFVEEEFGSIRGTVLADTDNNGTGDTGIPGVTLTLKDGSGNDIDSDPNTAGVQPTTTITDGNGDYVFSGLTEGNYRVVETQPSGYDSVSDVDGANNDTVGDESSIVVTPGNESPGNDFVELQQSVKPDTYAAYLAGYGPALGGETAIGDNPDGDIYPNALEYAFCLNAVSGIPGHGEFCLEKAADGTVSARFMRRRGGLSDVTYTLEGAATLGSPTTWTTLSVAPVVNTSDADVPFEAEKVTCSNIQTASPTSAANGVVRLKVEVDADESGTITPDEVFYTKIFGWQCLGFNDYQCATYSNPFSNKPVFSGTFAPTGVLTTATDGDGNVTLDVSDSALGGDLTAIVGSGGSHYLQITSGPLEGERFDILSGGVDELTLVNDPDIFSETDGLPEPQIGVESLNTSNGIPADNLLNGARFEVIRYQTVNDLFDPATAFAGEEDTAPYDFTRLLFYNNRKDEPGFEVLGLVGTNTTNSKWVFTNDLVGLNDQGSLRIDPSMGNWIHPKSSGDFQNPAATAPVIQFASGIVAEHDQAVALNEGFNLTGAMWPLDQTPAGADGRDLTVASGFDGGIDPNNSTELLFWSGDGIVDDPINTPTYSEGYTNYMLLDGGGMKNWVDINDIGLDDLDGQLLMESHRAVFLKILSGDQKEPHVYPQPTF